MAIKFDINKVPPALANITLELQQAQQARALLRKKNIRFLIYILLVVAAYATFMLTMVIPLLEDPSVVPDLVATIAYFTPYLTFFIFFVGNNLHHKIIEKPRKVLDTTLKMLVEASPEELLEITKPGKKYDEVSAYQKQVATLKRPLMKGEVDMIQQWAEARERKEKGIKPPSIHDLTI